MQSSSISTYPTISPAALKQHELALRIRVFKIEPTAKHKHLTVTAEGSIHFEIVLSQAYPLAAGLTQAQAQKRAKTLLKELHDRMEAGKSKRDSTSPLDFPPDMPNLFHLQHLRLQNVEPVYSDGQVHPAKPKLVEYWKATFYHRLPVGKGADGKTIYATTAGQYLSFTSKNIIHSLDALLLPIYTAAARALQLPHGAVWDATTAVTYRLLGNMFLPMLRTTKGEVALCEGDVGWEDKRQTSIKNDNIITLPPITLEVNPSETGIGKNLVFTINMKIQGKDVTKSKMQLMINRIKTSAATFSGTFEEKDPLNDELISHYVSFKFNIVEGEVNVAEDKCFVCYLFWKNIPREYIKKEPNAAGYTAGRYIVLSTSATQLTVSHEIGHLLGLYHPWDYSHYDAEAKKNVCWVKIIDGNISTEGLALGETPLFENQNIMFQANNFRSNKVQDFQINLIYLLYQAGLIGYGGIELKPAESSITDYIRVQKSGAFLYSRYSQKSIKK